MVVGCNYKPVFNRPRMLALPSQLCFVNNK